MVLKELKKEVLQANKLLSEYHLVTFTWGNVSGFCKKDNLIVIKPSGIDYNDLKIEDMVVVDLNGNVVEGDKKPSSDTPTHIVLYKKFPEIGGVVHTHSSWATSFSQAGQKIPCLGTTHADYFYGDIPCTRKMKKEEVEKNYEHNTGEVIVETFLKNNIDPRQIPGVLMHGHAPFIWGNDSLEAIENAAVLEEVAKISARTIHLNPNINPIDSYLLNKHYLRKHGKDAYYGQN